MTYIFASIAFTISHLIVSAVWVTNYSKVRKNRIYSLGKSAIDQDFLFKMAGRMIFLVGTILTVACFWSDSPLLLKFHHSQEIQALGIIISILATMLYLRSLRTLGRNYAPCYDSHKPHEIIQHGPYQLVRHPVYTANILNSIGVIVASGSFIVLALGIYGIARLVKAALVEEVYLQSQFEEYKNYMSRTWRLIPYVF